MKTLHKPIELREMKPLNITYPYCGDLQVGSITFSSRSIYNSNKKWYIETSLPLEVDLTSYEEKDKAIQALENAFNAFLYNVIA